MMMYSTIVWPFLLFRFMLRLLCSRVFRTDERGRPVGRFPRRVEEDGEGRDHREKRGKDEDVLHHRLPGPLSHLHHGENHTIIPCSVRKYRRFFSGPSGSGFAILTPCSSSKTD